LVYDFGASEKVVLEQMSEISFAQEFKGVKDGLAYDGLQIKYRYQLATEQNLIDCLKLSPIGIHFSGHGLENKKDTFKSIAPPNYCKQIEGKGDILVFENNEGGSSYFLFRN
jgi:hypothetical protein